ncbi:TetR/AcrR family transcriptional regulator [Roseobacteraceae bacterium NS-SX3]
MAKRRLSREDWILEGFNALAEQGPGALKAEVLARRLGSSKGSFYWHFPDVPAFHAALLEYWEAQAVAAVIETLAPLPDPRARLRMLARLATETPQGLQEAHPPEPAIRAWAREASPVRAALARIDARRLAYLEEQLNAAGITPEPSARLIYAALIGLEDLGGGAARNRAALDMLLDMVFAASQPKPPSGTEAGAAEI